MFNRVVSESFATGCRYFFSQKSSKCAELSQSTHLMVFFYKFWFLTFSGGIKKTRVMKCVKKYFLCVDSF